MNPEFEDQRIRFKNRIAAFNKGSGATTANIPVSLSASAAAGFQSDVIANRSLTALPALTPLSDRSHINPPAPCITRSALQPEAGLIDSHRLAPPAAALSRRKTSAPDLRSRIVRTASNHHHVNHNNNKALDPLITELREKFQHYYDSNKNWIHPPPSPEPEPQVPAGISSDRTAAAPSRGAGSVCVCLTHFLTHELTSQAKPTEGTDTPVDTKRVCTFEYHTRFSPVIFVPASVHFSHVTSFDNSLLLTLEPERNMIQQRYLPLFHTTTTHRLRQFA